MQRKFPALSPKELIRVLHKLGVPSREGKGSHIIFYAPMMKETLAQYPVTGGAYQPT